MITDAAVLFGGLDAPARRWRPLSPRTWTCVGAVAIPLWATWPNCAPAYATPLCSALLLALLGLELFSWGLVIGAIVIVLAGFLSRAESRQTQS